MTDNEIIKALECCAEPVGINCCKCPLEKDCLEVNMCELSLDLINRLQAENERLCMELDEVIIAKDLLFDEAEALIKKTKAEAVKEFAERLKTEFSQYQREYRNVLNDEGACAMIIAKKGVDNLVKEMVGENNETKTF